MQVSLTFTKYEIISILKQALENFFVQNSF